MRLTPRVKRIIAFIEQLTVPSGTGAGGPVKLRRFERRFIQAVYGPVNREGRRMIRRAILSMGRKNGKSFLTAALALVHLVGPESIPNGEIYSAANDRDQAALIFKYATQMVRADPELAVLVKIIDSTKTMVFLGNGSFYRAVSAEAGTKFGFNPTVVIYDELAQSKNRALFDALDTSMGAREEPLLLVISTQSNDPQHILSQLIDDGLSGRDETTVCHLYEVPEEVDDVFDPKVWKLANPALGDFRSLAELKAYAKKAMRLPSFEASFRNLYLNQRVNFISPFIPRAEWEGCKKEETEGEIPKGAEIYLGLDLSGKIDLCALAAVTAGPESRAKAWFWKPAAMLIEHEKRDRVPYPLWVKQGFIEAPPGRAINHDFVATRLAEISREYVIIGVAYDRWRIDDFVQACNRIGLEFYVEGKDDARVGAIRLVPWGQGFKDMAPAIDALEVSIMERHFIHTGNPPLTWCFSNTMTIADAAGNRKLDKSATRFRIDGAVAITMAEGLKSRDIKEGPQPSVYEGMSAEDIKARMAY